MRRSVRLKTFGITVVLLVLMVIVSWLSVLNLRSRNN